MLALIAVRLTGNRIAAFAAAVLFGLLPGVVAQAVLDKPLKQGSAIEYRIRGPWAAPEVLKVEEGTP